MKTHRIMRKEKIKDNIICGLLLKKPVPEDWNRLFYAITIVFFRIA